MSGNYRENNNNNSYTSIDKRSLLNPEIEDESPMFRRRSRAEEDDEERGRSAQNQEIRPKPKSPTWKGENAKSIVYGGLDAIVTCFSLISSISSSGGRMSSVDVLVLGFANLVADGISMGFGDYLSSSTEKEMAFKEKDVTQWEVDHHGTSQIRQLMQRYQELGMDPHDATTVADIFAKYKNIMVEENMMGQKGLLLPDQEEKPWKSGLVTFISFLLFGCAPLLSFIILIPFTDDDTIKFIGACILSVFALTLLGVAKANISGASYTLSALMTVSNGVIAAAVAYSIGWSLRNLAGLEEP
ncbi:protein CCC1 [Beta vulgaris subsp. vulgaris]|uniref:protein CCC1 n=1 Tax=Beta vulgaris subsp. vulgaris TaxID=3555 RepID=UPI0020366A2F|nr:protein CCC1 [Beta vulgaris subsp. vulgaris]